ncbi:MAG: ATP phosphoribosyltransferase [Candidatus Ancillula sp.]|jgi:ATP phosphoribosyltransferase|nr:ATP phosphoribosyltransferase [Candidatus Ancillula sp.]
MTIKIAVPNKGSLSEKAVEMLKSAGYSVRADLKQLVLHDAQNDVQFFYLRPRDIATYVGSGTLDAGVTGVDLLEDSDSDASTCLELGFADSTFRFASRPGVFEAVSDLSGKRIATAYPVLLGKYFDKRGVTPAKIVKLDGAVESAVELGVADAIADVVSTGTTLKQAGLQIFEEPIMHSTAVLITAPKYAGTDTMGLPAQLQVLIRRLQGVIRANEYVLMDYDIEEKNLSAAVAITPGFAGPTVSDLGTANWKAVRVLVPKRDVNKIMDLLSEVGAKAILTTQILASRL